MNEYPDWIKGKIRHTDKNAKPVKFRDVQNRTVIKVKDGNYRSANLNGIFELMNPPDADLPGRLLVQCSWFGLTPPTTYPQIDISNATTKIIEKYSGKVLDDIGRNLNK